MSFSKSFPRNISGVTSWEEITLSESEEKEVEQRSRFHNMRLFSECLGDAKKIMEEKQLKDFQTDQVHIAIALFEKRASHTVFEKEAKAKEKFDSL